MKLVDSIHCNEPEVTSVARALAIVGSDFYSYWQEHGKEYEQKEQQYKDKGGTGAPVRDHQLWVGRMNRFIASNGFKELLKHHPQSPEILYFEVSVDKFLQSYNEQGTKSLTAKKKTKEFLRELYISRDTKMNPSNLKEIKKRFQKHGIKAISDKTILECHQLLRSALNGDVYPS